MARPLRVGTSMLGALALEACAPRATTDGPLQPPVVLATVGAGERAVRVLNGGYGSALVADPDDPNAFFLLTDRGPNVDGPARGEKLFPVPSFAPRIGRFRLENGAFVLRDTIILKAPDATPMTPPSSCRTTMTSGSPAVIRVGGYSGRSTR